ncbi:MAG: hypothetical protein ACOCWL_01790, partial [Thermoguttaceae bacterium]
MNRSNQSWLLGIVAVCWMAVGAFADQPLAPNRFVEVARSDTGGHFFSQVIYAPPIEGLVSWGTRTHQHEIRAHETRHFAASEGEWIDAFPTGKAAAWAGDYRQW